MSYTSKAIDEIGGININIPEAITAGGFSFNPGQQQLYGQLALVYARNTPSDELNTG